MAFWALEVAPGKEFSAIPPFDLHLTQVVLPANATDNGRSVLQAKIDDKQFAVASLKLDRQENISLDLIFEAGKPIIFTVSGKNTVQLLGYYIDNQGGLSDDEDDFDGDSFGEFDEDEEVDSEEGEDGLEGLDSDDEDDEELDEEEISKATLAQLQQKRKAQLEQPANGAKKAKVEPQQQKGQQQKGQPQQQQKGQQQAQQQKGQQQKGDQKQQQKPQTPQQNQQRPQTPKQDQKGTPQQQKEQKEGGSRSVGGVKIDTMVIGTGAQAQVGKKVRVMYTGRLENGKVFDKSRSPFSFRLGGQEVIKGWDIGVNGMRVGEKRKLTIPPQLGYGRGGAPPDIPGNATLIFDVELVGV